MKIDIGKTNKWLPFAISLLIFIAVVLTMQCELICGYDFEDTLKSIMSDIITISGILSGIIIAYLSSKVIQIRQEKLARLPELMVLTQKVHKFRAIVNQLINSDLWVDGLKGFINHKYKGLSYFEAREIVFVNGTVTKRATDFTNDHKFGDTKNLFLELKSFLFEEYPFDDMLYSEFEVPVYYHTDILEKWIKYDCGNGLWYYFENKYSIFHSELKLEKVYSGYQEDILKYCQQIDRDRYENLKFGPELLALLGTQFTSDTLPKLYRLQLIVEKTLPGIVIYLFLVLCSLIVFGILLPLLIKIYSLDPAFEIVSVAMVISICIYIITSFYSFLKNEITI